ncbi:hypothetical protein MSPP1_000417 [Malassezia sp. CBS 17886]|nr:hypothetical protein MSPP1_000417 [Malassezia sp. CBS 17886]
MAPILNFHPGSLPSFSLRLRDDDTLDSIRARAAQKLDMDVDENAPLTMKYLYQKQLYKLDDGDDYDIFVHRTGASGEADIFIASDDIGAAAEPVSFQAQAPTVPNVPVLDETTLVTRTPARGKSGAVSIHRVPASNVPGVGEYVGAGGVSGGGRDSILYPPPREPQLPSYMKPIVPSAQQQDAASMKSKKTTQTTASAALRHRIAFEEFHAQRGVRLLRGSLGPVNNVPMMLKSGYRHVYVSRSFALDHGFIPVDTTPGTYGYNGITNLGKWPVQVGSKSVPCTVMLAEDSYFPVILGRSFMEKRGVRTDPIVRASLRAAHTQDMTSVIFMDNGERADVEVVVVRDEVGQPVSIP